MRFNIRGYVMGILSRFFGGGRGRAGAQGAAQGAGVGAMVGGPLGALVGGLGGGALGMLAAGGDKSGLSKSQRKKLKRYEKEARAYSKKLYEGTWGEKKYNERLQDWLRRYGKEKFIKQPVYTRFQRKLYDDLIDRAREDLQATRPGMRMGLQSIEDLLSPDSQAYQKFAAPEMRKYQEQVIPGIVERFGAGGQRNSALNAALAHSGVDLQERLAAMRAGLQQQARQDMLNYDTAAQRQVAMGLEAKPNQFIYRPAVAPTGYIVTGGPKPITPAAQPQQPGALQQAGGQFLGAAAQGLGSIFAEKLGAKFGEMGGGAGGMSPARNVPLWGQNNLGGMP